MKNELYTTTFNAKYSGLTSIKHHNLWSKSTLQASNGKMVFLYDNARPHTTRTIQDEFLKFLVFTTPAPSQIRHIYLTVQQHFQLLQNAFMGKIFCNDNQIQVCIKTCGILFKKQPRRSLINNNRSL